MSPRFKDDEGRQIKNKTREQLVTAAAEIFARDGYEKASVDMITTNAGVSTGTVYNYFASKAELMMALLEEIGKAHCEYISERVSQQTDPIARVEQLFTAGFEYVQDHPTRSRVLFANMQGPITPFKERLSEIYQPLVPLIIDEIIVPGMEQKIFDQVPPVSTATMILTFYLGIGSLVGEDGRVPLDMNEIVSFVLRALGTKLRK